MTGIDVGSAYSITIQAAEIDGTAGEVRERIKSLVAGEGAGGFVAQILARELRL